jgi:hypothetical protein
VQQRERIARIIEEFSQQGIHRTATEVDQRSAEWLASQVEAIGLEPTLEPFEINRIDLGECYLEVGGRRITGVPLFDSMDSPPDGVRGRLGAADSDAEIALIAGPYRTTAATAAETRRANSARAMVVVTEGPNPGLALLNARDFVAPSGPPSVQVSSDEGAWLRTQAELGAEVLVVAAAKRSSAVAYNVTAELAGADASRAPLAVNTPRSGWWECAAERGGGIACWLETMRSLVGTGSPRRVFFSACTGHELGYIGMEAILDAHPELTTGATWLHFGANIGSASGTRGNVAVSTDELRSMIEPELTSITRPLTFASGPDSGEMAIVHRRGGRTFIAVTNDNTYFHMPGDSYPDNVDIGSVDEFARGFSAAAQALATGLA